jgi:hypothetical protein
VIAKYADLLADLADKRPQSRKDLVETLLDDAGILRPLEIAGGDDDAEGEDGLWAACRRTPRSRTPSSLGSVPTVDASASAVRHRKLSQTETAAEALTRAWPVVAEAREPVRRK